MERTDEGRQTVNACPCNLRTGGEDPVLHWSEIRMFRYMKLVFTDGRSAGFSCLFRVVSCSAW